MRAGDEYDALDAAPATIGSYGAIGVRLTARRTPKREFPPGIAGAKPGPSHDEDPSPRPRKPRRRPAK